MELFSLPLMFAEGPGHSTNPVPPMFGILAILTTLSALFSYFNHKVLKLPTTIGLMLIALVFSLVLLGIGQFYPHMEEQAKQLFKEGGYIDFNELLMHGMLGFLLFAGALHVNLSDLAEEAVVVLILATLGVLVSTFLVGGLAYLVLNSLLQLEVAFVYCLIFGALISPTDPIAVLAIMKQVAAPKSLETQIAGESLFNDGVGVVVFLVIYGIAFPGPGEEVTVLSVTQLFLWESVGGGIFGLIIGFIAYQMLRTVDNYQVEILLSLAVVAGGFALADYLHLSGPIAMVVAGLLIGNHGRTFAMSPKTVEHLDLFWELVDEFLNAVLFVLIGLEILAITFQGEHLLAGLIIIPLVLLARFLSVGLPVSLLSLMRPFGQRTITLLTWGGLRGGISVALALSLPTHPASDPGFGEKRELLVMMTYTVVIFSIVVQGLSIGALMRKFYPSEQNSLETETGAEPKHA